MEGWAHSPGLPCEQVPLGGVGRGLPAQREVQALAPGAGYAEGWGGLRYMFSKLHGPAAVRCWHLGRRMQGCGCGVG